MSCDEFLLEHYPDLEHVLSTSPYEGPARTDLQNLLVRMSQTLGPTRKMVAAAETASTDFKAMQIDREEAGHQVNRCRFEMRRLLDETHDWPYIDQRRSK